MLGGLCCSHSLYGSLRRHLFHLCLCAWSATLHKGIPALLGTLLTSKQVQLRAGRRRRLLWRLDYRDVAGHGHGPRMQALRRRACRV